MKAESSSKRKNNAKKIYFLPNLFTTANLFCGFLSIAEAIEGRFISASWVILLAMVFDSLDGRVARMTRSTSDFGVQYDSLSDLTSFGLAPAFLAYLWALKPFNRLGLIVAFFYAGCAAFRLARFNINTAMVPKGYFQGLPSPLAACLIASGILFYKDLNIQNSPLSVLQPHWFIIFVTLVSAALMVSKFLFPSFKEVKMNRESAFSAVAVFVLTMTIIVVQPEVSIFSLGIFYVILSFFLQFYRFFLLKKRGLRGTGENKIDEKIYKSP